MRMRANKETKGREETGGQAEITTMGAGQRPPPNQQHYAHAPAPAPYPPQQQYYAHPSQQSEPQYQQSQHHQYHQYQQYQQSQPTYQQPPQQQQQYYYPHQQPQYASPHSAAAAAAAAATPSAPQPSPPVASPLPQPQQFFAELDASGPPPPTLSQKPNLTSASASPPSPGAGPGPVVFEMPAEAQPPSSKAQDPSPTPHAAAPISDTEQQAGQKPPAVPQANPWGFFLDDGNDLPECVASASASAPASPAENALSVKPLRIVKTGPADDKPPADGRPPSGASQDVAPQETGAGGSPDAAQLAPAPLHIVRPQPPAGPALPVPAAAPPASQVPYPVDGPSIPTPESHPGARITLPLHPRSAAGSPPNPASPTTFAPSPLTPMPTATAAVQQQQQQQPQQQHYYAQPPQAYTQALPVSPVIVQAGLPPTLPVGSYFPQQPTYARPEATQQPAQAGIAASSASSASAHHSPVPSVLSTTHAGDPQTAQTIQAQHSPARLYASPPPSYTQAVTQTVTQTQPAATSSPPAPAQFHHQPPTPTQPLSPTATGVSSPMSPPPSQYPYSPSCVGADKLNFHHHHHHHQGPAIPQQQHPSYNPQASPPVPQPLYVNGPQQYHPNAPPLPPRTSPLTPGGQYGHAAPPPSPYGPPPTRPNYQAQPPPPKPDSRLFSSATARKLLSKTTELVDQTITPYLQDHRYRPPYNAYQYQYQYPSNRPLPGPQGPPYYQQGYGPSQPTYAAPQVARENPDGSRTS
ncbi:hypothetical protein CTA1_287 [Colletotrichum tanaceti]|uniref:Uncharacterized protein n=1 Tax=Colletotrichum tanaceti TaxID=1306861 RepID=A0A4U6XD64_9PEZI|nr:hypothetical protein CTA1_287 [Colletotrichum tanaceti]